LRHLAFLRFAGEGGHRDALEVNERPGISRKILSGEIKPPEDAQKCFSFS